MHNINKVVIIIPIYNEREIIADTVESIFKCTSQLLDAEIAVLIFDSNSNDGSQEIIATMQKQYPRLHYRSELKKSGLGSAYYQAFRIAIEDLQADIVFEFDADGSHKPEYIEPILEKIKQGADVVVGSRYIPGGSIPQEWQWHRKFLSVVGNWLARVVLTRRYFDFTSGFRATRSELIKKVLPKKFLSNQYAYKLELFWLLHLSGANIEEYPIQFIDREKGYSKFPRNNMLDSLRVILILRLKMFQRYAKMCCVGLSGALIQFLIFNLLRHHDVHPTISNIFAIECAILSNFFVNNAYTFRDKRLIKSFFPIKQLIKFNLFSLISMFIQTAWLIIGLGFLGHGFFTENLLVLSGMFLGSLSNYFCYSKYVW